MLYLDWQWRYCKIIEKKSGSIKKESDLQAFWTSSKTQVTINSEQGLLNWLDRFRNESF